MVGQRLTELLLEKGHAVKHLSRSGKTDGKVQSYVWSLAEDYLDPDALNDVDVIVHLAGAGILDEKWTDARKKVLVDSRVASLNLLKSAASKPPT